MIVYAQDVFSPGSDECFRPWYSGASWKWQGPRVFCKMKYHLGWQQFVKYTYVLTRKVSKMAAPKLFRQCQSIPSHKRLRISCFFPNYATQRSSLLMVPTSKNVRYFHLPARITCPIPVGTLESIICYFPQICSFPGCISLLFGREWGSPELFDVFVRYKKSPTMGERGLVFL